MRRAVVWLCWGQAFVAEAIESSKTAAALQIDRILITDASGVEYAKAHGEFTSLISMQPAHRNTLEKSRLIDLLPDGYDTFLFLDTDTRILGDVTLGFDKAERHGIAMAPAPNYNLCTFEVEQKAVGSIMPQLGVEPADQFQYNSGVIFFHLSPAVRQVLERWRDLCASVAAELDFPNDQPFLTLALEQLAFTPYVLSPLYNYRSLGEPAVGSIRIWHTHFPPPSNVNTFDKAWPARRFRRGVRLPRDSNPPDAARKYPQTMLRVMMRKFAELHTAQTRHGIADKAGEIQRQEGSLQAMTYLLGKLGVEMSVDRNEAYCAEALHFHLGLLEASSGRPAAMAEHIRLSRTMAGPEDERLFSDHVTQCLIMREHQLDAIARNMPAILFACMPRSASATLTYSLAKLLDVPVLHTAMGVFPDYFLAPSWLDIFLEGGALTHDHFMPNDFNFGILKDRGPRDVFVTIRDPRAAARSQVHWLSRWGNLGSASVEERIERQCIDNFIPWLQSWIDRSRDPASPLRVHAIKFEDVVHDLAGTIRRIAHVLQDEFPAMAAYAACVDVEEVRMHFNRGDDDAWRSEVGDATRQKLWNACTADIKELLQLAS